MKRQYLLTPLLLLLLVYPATAATSTAKVYPYQRIDNHALKTPQNATESIGKLASYLSSAARNDTDKARAIFRWIAENITYDVESLKPGAAKPETAQSTLKNRKAVCRGISSLFEELCKASGLEVVTIIGFAKGYSYIPGSDMSRSNHAWNAVKIDGVWRLVDPTWGAGYIDDDGKYVRYLENHYFLTKPEEFIYTHLPEDSGWQLLEQKITKVKFQQLANLKPPFFKNDLSNLSHKYETIRASERLSISVDAPSNVSIGATLYYKNRELSRDLTFSQSKDGRYYIHCAFPESGYHQLRIFAAESGEEVLELVLEYSITVDKGVSRNASFPEIFGDFRARGAFLHFPMQGVLDKSSQYTFKIDVPDAEEVVLIQGENFCIMNLVDWLDETWTVATDMIPGDARIGARYPGDDHYKILLGYVVK